MSEATVSVLFMDPLIDRLNAAIAVLTEVARVDRATLSDIDLIRLVRREEKLSRLVTSSQVQSAAEVAERSRQELCGDGLSARNGFPKPLPFLEYLTGAGQRELGDRVRLGAAIRPGVSLTCEALPAEFPLLAESIRSGHVSVDCGSAIVRHLRQGAYGASATPERLEAAERSLVQIAVEQSVDAVTAAARAWREALDPDGAEPRFEEIRARRGLSKRREKKGITAWQLRTDPLGTALLDAVLAEATTPGAVPRFLADDDRSGGTTRVIDVNGDEIDVLNDPRSRQQKQLDVLTGVLSAGLRASHDSDPSLRATGTVIATVTLDLLERGVGVGWLAGVDEPVPAATLQRMACDSRVRIQVLGKNRVPLFEAVSNRFFSDAHRRAMLTRDGDRCCGPGCQIPATWADAHHVQPWSHDGPTNVSNGVLLCQRCHTGLHAGDFEMQMIDGHPHVRLNVDHFNSAAWRPADHQRTVRTAA